MSIESFKDPLIIKWWKDSNGNKITVPKINESQVVVNNKLYLNEIPAEFNRIEITGYYELEIGSIISTSTEFTCDYSIG